MNIATELSLLDEYIDLLHTAQKKMRDEDALRAVRTIKHLSDRRAEIKYGKPAGFW